MALPACCNCSPCLFTVHLGKWPSPTLWVGCASRQSLLGAYPLQACWGVYATPAFSSRLVYLQFMWGSAPPPLYGRACHRGKHPSPYSRIQGAPPSLPHVQFFNCLFIIQVFFVGQESVCPRGLCWFFPRVAVGEPCATYLLTCGSAKRVRSWYLAAQEPSWFLRIPWCGGAMCRLGVWRCQSFASSWWLFLTGVSPASQENFYFKELMLSASSL
jgi:hypothetical protein